LPRHGPHNGFEIHCDLVFNYCVKDGVRFEARYFAICAAMIFFAEIYSFLLVCCELLRRIGRVLRECSKKSAKNSAAGFSLIAFSTLPGARSVSP
jgi:hypothetical protein